MAASTTSDTTSAVLKRLIKLPKSWTKNPARELIMQGIIFMEEDRKLKPRVCLLFNDIFLITKPQCEFVNDNTAIQDENTQLKFKNFLFLRSCYIDESPKTIKKVSNLVKEHETYPFVLTGENPLNHKNMQIAMSCKNIHDRQNWLKNTHRAIIKIHQSTFSDYERYGWENTYRRGTLFHAMYSNDNELLNQLIGTLFEEDNIASLNKENQNVNSNSSSPKESNKDAPAARPFRKQSRDLQTKLESQLDEGGHTLLHLAAFKNNSQFIHKYGNKFSIDLPDKNGWTALRIACDNRNYGVIKELIALGANVDETYPFDKKANPYIRKAVHDRRLLHEFCGRSGDVTIVRMLLYANELIEIETYDEHGMTPLHLACQHNHELIVLLLLRYGAPPNLPDYLINRPLHLATSENVARWLMAYGARVDLQNKQGQLAMFNLGEKLAKYKTLYGCLSENDCNSQGQVIDESAWFDDKLSDACLLCKDKFTMRNRRHHCRKCGLLVCGPCSLKKLLFIKEEKEMAYRVCDKCFNLVHTNTFSKRKYEINSKQVTMQPCDYLAMITMNLTENNSYNEMTHSHSALNSEVNMDDIKMDDEKNDNFDNSNSSNSNNNSNSSINSSKHVSSKSMTLGSRKSGKYKSPSPDHAYSKTVLSQTDSSVSNAKNLVAQANVKAAERGDKLKDLGIKSEQMADNAKNFNDLAKQLAKKKW